MSHPHSRTAARLTALYEAHAADAFRYALHLTGRREDAEDVVQYVFLQAYAALEGGRDLVNPRAWLIKATKHRSLNLIRDRRDMPAAEVHATGPSAADPGEADALAGVRATLWSLPEPQHHAFVLRHWSGLSQDEIADVLATTPGAVESLLVRARATLVAEQEDGDSECAGVRGRLVRMLAPTPAHEAHLAGCRRCRTAQTRLLRATGFAAALVPGPQVAHALAAAVPGFGASGAAAATAATGASGAGAAGSGGAAVSTASLATKAGLAAKIAMAATTAAVAVTAVHPVRTAVSHAILGSPAGRSAAAAAQRPAPGQASAAHRTTGGGAIGAGGTSATGAGNGNGAGSGGAKGKAHGQGKGGGKPAAGSPGNGAGKGKSGTAGSNGNGNGQGGAPAKGGANGNSASAPGKTKSAGSKAATGKGNAGGASPTNPANGNGGSGGSSNAGGNGGGSGSNAGGAGPNAGGNGKGNGKP